MISRASNSLINMCCYRTLYMTAKTRMRQMLNAPPFIVPYIHSLNKRRYFISEAIWLILIITPPLLAIVGDPMHTGIRNNTRYRTGRWGKAAIRNRGGARRRDGWPPRYPRYSGDIL